MTQLFANNAYSSLAANASNATTTLTLATGTGARFPSPTGGNYFLLTLVGLDSNANESSWEIVKVTARSTDTLTVVRAQEGTTAVAWNTGTRVESRATAGSLSNFLSSEGGTLTGPLTFASSQTFPEQIGPTIRPSLLLDFANSKTLDPRITFTRASAATYTGADGLIKTAESGEARFDHNPTTGESLGILIEEARTNLLTYSEQFDNAAWTKANATVTANATTAPDGTVTADKLVEDGVLTIHQSYRGVTILANTQHSFSVYVKSAERTQIQMELGVVVSPYAPRIKAIFNLSSMTVTAINSGTPTVANAPTITDAGNGWVKCSISGIFDTTSTNAAISFSLANGGTNTYQGDGTSGLYIWGAQLEAGAFPTSYIPTVASQATRAADNAVMTGTNFSSWYRQDEGTVFSYASMNQSSVDRTLASINDGTSNNRIVIATGASTAVYGPFVVCAGSAVATLIQSVSYPPSSNKLLALSYKVNDFAASLTGHTSVVDSSGNVPVVSTMNIGSDESGTLRWNGTIAKIAYYPKRLGNAELQSITTV